MACVGYHKVFDTISQDYFMDQIVHMSRSIILLGKIISKFPGCLTNESTNLLIVSNGTPQVSTFCCILPGDMAEDLEDRPSEYADDTGLGGTATATDYRTEVQNVFIGWTKSGKQKFKRINS